MLKYILLSICAVLVVGQPPDPNDPCRDCRMYNGVGFKDHATRCDRFYQCRWNRGRTGYIPTVRQCACGLFWNQDVLTCTFGGDTACKNDPCVATNIPSYGDSENCKVYWTCEGRRSISQSCCLDGERYNAATTSCEPDTGNTCNDKCPCDPDTTTGGPPPQCDFKPVVGQPERYIWEHENGRANMRCAIGTHFNVDTCKCDILVTVTTPAVKDCREVSVDYSGDPITDKAKGAWIESVRVKVDTPGTGIYNVSYLNMPRFSNADFNRLFGLEIEFRAKRLDNADGPLFDNCDCNEPSTISLRLGQTNDPAPLPMVYLTMITSDGPHNLQALYRDDERNTVKVAYEASTIYLSTYDSAGSVIEAKTEGASGRIATCQCGVKIGYAWDKRYFKGDMRKSDIYMECLPLNFIQ